MTLTFNSKKYQELLLTYQPKIIRNEQDNEQALAIVEELMNRQQRSLEENELYELLILLIENFEQGFYQKLDSQTASMIDFLMDQQDKTKTELAEVLGSQKLAVDLLAGKQPINLEQAQILGEFFKVDYSLFLES
ncbi:MAG: type II toxin-antitoxin system HigA family antitoxin [Microcystaceae cyanobacterium]